MSMYTFFFCSPDGSSSSFEAFHLPCQSGVAELAAKLLDEHPSCAYVAVWEGDRPVLERWRQQQPSGRSLDRTRQTRRYAASRSALSRR